MGAIDSTTETYLLYPRFVLHDQYVFQVRLFARREFVDEMCPARVQHHFERILCLAGIRVHISALRCVIEPLCGTKILCVYRHEIE